MIPGISARPPASMLSLALPSIFFPISTIFPLVTARSPLVGGEPRPSSSSAPFMTRSCMGGSVYLWRETLPALEQFRDRHRRQPRHRRRHGGAIRHRRLRGPRGRHVRRPPRPQPPRHPHSTHPPHPPHPPHPT